MSPVVALQSLELLLGVPEQVQRDPSSNGCVRFTLGTCHHLLSLTLRTDLKWPKHLTTAEHKPFLHLLPPSLRSLDIGEVYTSKNTLLEALAEPASLPSLHTLVLRDSTQVGDMREDGSEATWISARREKAVLCQVEEICEA